MDGHITIPIDVANRLIDLGQKSHPLFAISMAANIDQLLEEVLGQGDAKSYEKKEGEAV